MRAKLKRRKKPSVGRYPSRLTSKYQATIPKKIRDRLKLKQGDQVIYELLPDGTVVLKKSASLDLAYLEGIDMVMNEWDSEEDEEAYKDL